MDLMQRLREALPANHPLFGEVEEVIRKADVFQREDAQELEEARRELDERDRMLAEIADDSDDLRRVVDIIDDWRRGIRTWPEVELVLEDVAGPAHERTLRPVKTA